MFTLAVFFVVYSFLALLTLGIFWYSANHAKTDPELIEETSSQQKFIDKLINKSLDKKLNIKMHNKHKRQQHLQV